MAALNCVHGAQACVYCPVLDPAVLPAGHHDRACTTTALATAQLGSSQTPLCMAQETGNQFYFMLFELFLAGHHAACWLRC